MASVKVAVRVRPLNKRELDLESKIIIHMDGKKTRIVNLKVPESSHEGDTNRERAKDFTFDFSYHSMDPNNPHYASQDQVYQDLGRDVVDNAFEGYNACVFAYGQTGSGKTYTMMGSQEAAGLIPRICQNLFVRMKANRHNNTTYRTEVSYLEIYNESVGDLLKRGETQHTLKVRQHPKEGPYVAELSKHLVMDYSDIEELMNRGNSNRTTACTNMNDVSSRSHAIFTITFSQASFHRDMPSEIVSKVNLVDLAGSERADSSGATGIRLKEGASINKSLVTLGSVISALADYSSNPNKNKQVFIPYRDSVLTWLLKDSLGGNAKTIMLAAISPADVNYAETLSTLRYANRAKNIINKPTINEDTNVKLIRELKAEIKKLRTQLAGNNNKMATPHVIERIHENEARVKILTDEWTEKWKEIFRILEEQKTLGLRQFGTGVILDSELPHLIGIDDNILSTGVTLYHLKEGRTLIGREDASKKQDIVLSGLEAEEEHCIIENENGQVTLIPFNNALCLINSNIIDQPTRLYQGFVIVLGQSNMFRFNHPVEAAKLRKKGGSNLNLSRLSLLSQSMNDIAKSADNLHYSGLELEKKHEEDLRLLEEKKNQIKELEEQHQKAEEQRLLVYTLKEQEMEEKRLLLDKICLENETLKKQTEDAQKTIENDHQKLKRRSLDIEKQLQEYIIEKDKFQDERRQEREQMLAKERELEREKDEMQLTIEAEMKRLANIEEKQREAAELARQTFTQELEHLKQKHSDQLLSLEASHKALEQKEKEQRIIISEKEEQILQQQKEIKEERKRKLFQIELERKELQELQRELEVGRQIANEDNLLKEQKKKRLLTAAQELNSRQEQYQKEFDSAHGELEKWRQLVLDEINTEKQSMHNDYREMKRKEEQLEHMKQNKLISPEVFKNEQQLIESKREQLQLIKKNLCAREEAAQEKFEKDLENLHEKHRKTLESLNVEKINYTMFTEPHDFENIEQEIQSKKQTVQLMQADIEKAEHFLNQLTKSHKDSVSELNVKLVDERNVLESLAKKQEQKAEEVVAEINKKKIQFENQTQEEIEKLEKQRTRLMEWKLQAIPGDTADDPLKQELHRKLQLLQHLEEQYRKRFKELEEDKQRLIQERLQEVDRIEKEKLQLHEMEEQERINALVEQEVKRRLLEERLERERLFKIQHNEWKEQREEELKMVQLNHEKQLQQLKEEYQIKENRRCVNRYVSTPNLNSHNDVQDTRKHMERYFSINSLSQDPIQICIPTYILRGTGADTHYEYEIKLSVLHEGWTIYRRFKRFRELHLFMKRKYKEVATLYFPPRKLFSRSERVVNQRRPQLEEYLRKLIDLCMTIEDCPLCPNNQQPLSKHLLCEISPFFRRGVFEMSKYATS